MPKKIHDETLSLAELKKRAEHAKAQAAAIQSSFPEAHALPVDVRKHVPGRFGAAESVALRGVIDAIDLEPTPFKSLANEDDGHDASKLETDLLRDRLERHDVYAQLSETFQTLSDLFSDAALSVGAHVKPVTLAAYEIAKPMARRDDKLAAKLKPALDYYGANAAASLASRKAHEAAKKG